MNILMQHRASFVKKKYPNVKVLDISEILLNLSIKSPTKSKLYICSISIYMFV